MCCGNNNGILGVICLILILGCTCGGNILGTNCGNNNGCGCN